MADVRIRCVSKEPRQDPHHGVGGVRADVGVVDGPHGKYVRTYADGKWNDNLLALPECVAA